MEIGLETKNKCTFSQRSNNMRANSMKLIDVPTFPVVDDVATELSEYDYDFQYIQVFNGKSPIEKVFQSGEILIRIINNNNNMSIKNT